MGVMKLPANLILKQFELGPLQNFLYFLGDERTKEIAIIDPAWDVPFLIKEAQREGLKITQVFLTHGHPDHVNGLGELLKKFDVPVYISKHELQLFKPACKNLTEIEKGAVLKVGQISFKTILTPGHSPGCQCFMYENILIAGDTIFIDGCGRCDLPGSDPRMMYKSLYETIRKLPDETLIFPGHNYGPAPYDTVGHQKKTNPYLQSKDINDFLASRMGMAI